MSVSIIFSAAGIIFKVRRTGDSRRSGDGPRFSGVQAIVRLSRGGVIVIDDRHLTVCKFAVGCTATGTASTTRSSLPTATPVGSSSRIMASRSPSRISSGPFVPNNGTTLFTGEPFA